MLFPGPQAARQRVQSVGGYPETPQPEKRASESLGVTPTPPALHPLFIDARRLLDAMPVIEQLDIRDDEVRIIAALHAQRRLAEEAAERLIALLDELDAPNEDLEDGGDDEPSLVSATVAPEIAASK